MDCEELTASDVLVLQEIRDQESVSRRELNDAVPGVADRTIGVCLTRLREEGFVERRPNPCDARGYLYEPR